MKNIPYIKVILIIIALLAEYEVYINRFNDLNNVLTASIYVVLFIFLSFIVILSSYIKNDYIRLLFGLVFSVSFVFYDTYLRITTEFLTYSTFVSLINAKAFIGELFFQYFESILTSIIFGLILFIGLVLKPTPEIKVNTKIPLFAPLIGIILLTGILFLRGGDGGKGLPAMYIPVAYSNLYLYESITSYQGKRKQIDITFNNKAINNDIILIIDESVRGDYLDINSEYGVTSSLIDKYDDIDIYNYGIAASITNCSTETNITLRYGGTRENYQEIIKSMPSIWEYAKNIGMQTVYIDSQRIGRQLQNGINEDELEYIDYFIQFDNTPVLKRDIEAAKRLVEFINNDTHEFILINKIGAHFPVHDKYPDQYMKFKPALPRGQFLNISDTGSRDGFEGNDNWELYRNSYRNTLLWTVGEFFSIILNDANMENAVIIYTSDHGQDLHERNNPGLHTHCSGNPNIEEGVVPLVVIKGKSIKAQNLEKYLSNNYNNVSQYNIFPTLLMLMSYEKNDLKKIYGIPLNEKIDDPYTFNTQFHAKFGKQPKWKKIIIDKIARPEESVNILSKHEQ